MTSSGRHDRFHGRVRGKRQGCAQADCPELGEFRAPNPYGRGATPNGPGDYQWLCLDHVREFNARYNFFSGMSREEIDDMQSPAAGWASETRAFSQSGVDSPPKWADFHDPLEAISARFKAGMPKTSANGHIFSADEISAFKALVLDTSADKKQVRASYLELVRKYHPDRNGGDRSFEKKLQKVIDAYQLLQSSAIWR